MEEICTIIPLHALMDMPKEVRLKPFESNEEIRDRILERINARF